MPIRSGALVSSGSPSRARSEIQIVLRPDHPTSWPLHHQRRGDPGDHRHGAEERRLRETGKEVDEAEVVAAREQHNPAGQGRQHERHPTHAASIREQNLAYVHPPLLYFGDPGAAGGAVDTAAAGGAIRACASTVSFRNESSRASDVILPMSVEV